ncbi:ABC transporter ATP-binding protein [Propylenella binzhouense]|uniref:ABC transporter ATP-binding protein n=1 Tax=Propylenella binzhouense TaxID=2555902 RepID=A0A964T0P1_9HYPH|nr:ABC transporter ATP-binding protein [Propylenella binzhouense]MYZ46256.1 ABC transporter ATP-binding protein [Propylenella binzhouense]
MASSLLSVKSISARYGKVTAIEDLSLDVGEGEVIALLGANGSGKTTLLNTISGFIAPSASSIELRGEVISGEPPHRVFRAGVVQVSQMRDLFPAMTVLDNLELGAVCHRATLSRELEKVFHYFPRLAERRTQRVATLSGGEQQMVAIGRALMGRPRILLLDEPSGGLAPRFVQEIANIMNVLKAEGATMLIVEQNIAMALGAADRFYVIRSGTIARSGDVSELGDDHKALAREFYL